MNAHQCRILILATISLMIFSSSVEAQKTSRPAKKPASESKKPAEDQPIRKTGAALPEQPPPSKFSPLELAVVEEINMARREPQKFVGFLEEYRKAIKGKIISLPNRVPLRSVEGAPVIEEAIDAMKTVSNLQSLEISDKLSGAAAMQLKDLQEDSSLGHTGKNGSTLRIRLSHFTNVEGKSAENISFRHQAARDVALMFIIDDGVKSRMHRKNVLSATYKKIGVACGTGVKNDSLCVVVFAENLKDKNPASSIVEF